MMRIPLKNALFLTTTFASAAVLVTFQAAGAALVSVWLAPALAGALLVAAGLGYRARDGV